MGARSSRLKVCEYETDEHSIIDLVAVSCGSISTHDRSKAKCVRCTGTGQKSTARALNFLMQAMPCCCAPVADSRSHISCRHPRSHQPSYSHENWEH